MLDLSQKEDNSTFDEMKSLSAQIKSGKLDGNVLLSQTLLTIANEICARLESIDSHLEDIKNSFCEVESSNDDN